MKTTNHPGSPEATVTAMVFSHAVAEEPKTRVTTDENTRTVRFTPPADRPRR
jgi:hypothetical protein